MRINYNLIFKDGLTDAAIDKAFEFSKIKIYRDIDEIVKKHKYGYHEDPNRIDWHTELANNPTFIQGKYGQQLNPHWRGNLFKYFWNTTEDGITKS